MVAVLPKFIKLSPTLVKGVFDRLLVSYKGIVKHVAVELNPYHSAILYKSCCTLVLLPVWGCVRQSYY